MAAITKQIRQANIGRKILRAWKVDGCVPVPIEQAQARANVCLHGGPNGGKCPFNEPDENWLWDKAKAIYIAQSLNLRRIANIHLEGEKDLHTCGACGCVLRLKLHSPISHIFKHTPPQEYARYPNFCWVKTETTDNTTTQPHE